MMVHRMIFGDNWKEVIKNQIERRFYGRLTDKTMSIWHVKKLETSKFMYDIPEIKHKHTILNQYHNYYRGLTQFLT